MDGRVSVLSRIRNPPLVLGCREQGGGFLIIDYLIQKRALSDLPDVENKGGFLIIGGFLT